MSLADVFNQHTFFQLWRPDIFLLVVVLGTVYALVMGPYKKSLAPKAPPVTKGQKLSFYTGLLLFYLLHGTPFHIIGYDYLFSVHMSQMAFTYMVVIPLFMVGVPSWAWSALINVKGIKHIWPVLSYPLFSVIFFNLFLSLYHIPVIFEFVMENHAIHWIYHYFLCFAAFLLWWPIINPIKGDQQLAFMKKFGYLIAGSILITPVCALVIFAQQVIYDTYVDVPRLIEGFSVLDDQQLGAVIMKLVQETAYGTALIILFFSWIRREKPGSVVDPIEPKDLELIGEKKYQPSFTINKPSTEHGGS